MFEYVGWIWWLIVSLGILVTFHEFGHYWVGRLCGVRVLRFSVGFGQPIFRRVGRDGTEYVIAWLPLGGYVKFLDDREMEVPESLKSESFNSKSVFQRFAIVAAGPAFNLILCVALLWLMFLVGKGDFLPIIGQSQGIAAEAGLRADDRIISIDQQRMDTWTHAQIALATAAVDKRPVSLEVLRDDGNTRQLSLDLSQFDTPPQPAQALRAIGLIPQQFLLPPIVGVVSPNSAAELAGLKVDDKILSIGNLPIRSWDQIPAAIQSQAQENSLLSIHFERDGVRQEHLIQPKRDDSGEETRWLLGIGAKASKAEYDAQLRYGPIKAIGAALDETKRLTESTVGMLWRMVRGAVSLDNINGPISIAQYANATAQLGLAWFLSFLAMLSLSLCIMNLLPIPILDGGHLLYYLIEMVKGSPVSERFMVAGQLVGIVFLVGLMGLAFYNDILRLVSG